MKKFLMSLLEDESGLTTVEYAVGAAVVLAGAAATWITLGGSVNTNIQGLNTAVTNANP